MRPSLTTHLVNRDQLGVEVGREGQRACARIAHVPREEERRTHDGDEGRTEALLQRRPLTSNQVGVGPAAQGPRKQRGTCDGLDSQKKAVPLACKRTSREHDGPEAYAGVVAVHKASTAAPLPTCIRAEAPRVANRGV